MSKLVEYCKIEDTIILLHFILEVDPLPLAAIKVIWSCIEPSTAVMVSVCLKLST